ncbi:MAG: hypothetical protein ACOCQW_00030 [Halanaerobiaceae bacterium]
MKKKYIYISLILILLLFTGGCKFYFTGNNPEIQIIDVAHEYGEDDEGEDSENLPHEDELYKHEVTVKYINTGSPGKIYINFSFSDGTYEEKGPYYTEAAEYEKEFFYKTPNQFIDGTINIKAETKNGKLLDQYTFNF